MKQQHNVADSSALQESTRMYNQRHETGATIIKAQPWNIVKALTYLTSMDCKCAMKALRAGGRRIY